jgi:lipopolysaccharide biosynthesis glycosyltransferase
MGSSGETVCFNKRFSYREMLRGGSGQTRKKMTDKYTVPTLMPLSSGEKPVIPVVAAIDANFAPVYAAFLASLLAHADSRNMYDLILLTENVPNEYVRAFHTQIRPYANVALRTVDMTDFPVPILDKVSFRKPAFFRLALPALLPGYDRAVYLDTDTVLLHDVAELYNSLTATNSFAAAVPDIPIQAHNSSPHITEDYLGQYGNMSTYLREHLGLGAKVAETYFNSGVIVFNFEEIRKANLSPKFMELLAAKPFIFVDQDILNMAFNGNVQLLPQKWNFFPVLNPKMDYTDEMLVEREKAAQDIHLIHYATRKKPWSEAGHVPFEEYFWFYARQSIYYEELRGRKREAKRIAAQAARLPNLMKQRIAESLPLRSLKRHFPGAYGVLRALWRKLRYA